MPDTTTYRLCGFASGVDWRPVAFKERLPKARICDLCGFVAAKMAVLPCSHVLCESCVEGCTHGGDVFACAMDETPFEGGGDVCWISPPREHLAKLRVRCWNADHGCDFEGPAGDLLEHFETQCAFHCTSCPRCQESVLRKELPRHYRAECAGAIMARTAAASGAVIAPPTGPGTEVDSGSYHDILASIQSRVNELAEAVVSIGDRAAEAEEERSSVTRASADTRRRRQDVDLGPVLEALNATKVALERSFNDLKQTLRREVVGALPECLENALTASGQRLCPTAPFAEGLGDGSALGTPGDAGVHYVVVTLINQPWNEPWNKSQFLEFPIPIDQSQTGVYIACLTSRLSNFFAVYVKATLPTEWSLPVIRQVSGDDLKSPALKDWRLHVMNLKQSDFCFSVEDRSLRCMCGLASQDWKKTSDGRTQIDLLVEMRKIRQ
ncbi:hypothetical protein V5799_002959 [Amblyomma americanum]|uniref:TRAF-type domain-containing protein n=1 Tax=Amblyomma americanum TaxID=6943 RepID=A0AAQ4DAB9_AMBAM